MCAPTIVLAVFIILSCAPPGLAQKGTDKSQPPPAGVAEEEERKWAELNESLNATKRASEASLEVPRPAELPKGKGAWVLQLVTRGGFAGGGKGDLTVSSLGGVDFTQAGAVCRQELPAEALRSLAGVVAAAKTTGWKAAQTGVCRDCYVTIMLLRRREADGRVRSHLFHWDDVTASKVPEDVLRLHDTALALASVRQ